MQHPFTSLISEEFRRWQAKRRRRRIVLLTIRAVDQYLSTPEGKEKLEARIRAKKENEENENDGK